MEKTWFGLAWIWFQSNRHRWKYWFRRSRPHSRYASQSENDSSCWYVSAMSSAYWNWFDNVDGILDKYRLNSAKTLPWGSSLLSLLHLLLLSPRKTWKKRFNNILFSKFVSLAQGTTRINFNIKPSHNTVSYAAVRSKKSTPVLSLRWKPAFICDACAKTCSVQLRFHSLKYLENDTEQWNWPKVRKISNIFFRFKHRNNFGALKQLRNFTRRQNIAERATIHYLVLWPEFLINSGKRWFW
jgi:hypothetical protein